MPAARNTREGGGAALAPPSKAVAIAHRRRGDGRSPRASREGFTLLEILIALAILSAVAAALFAAQAGASGAVRRAGAVQSDNAAVQRVSVHRMLGAPKHDRAVPDHTQEKIGMGRTNSIEWARLSVTRSDDERNAIEAFVQVFQHQPPPRESVHARDDE